MSLKPQQDLLMLCHFGEARAIEAVKYLHTNLVSLKSECLEIIENLKPYIPYSRIYSFSETVGTTSTQKKSR